MKQYKKDIQKYYEDFKTLNNVVEELNKSDHGSPFVDIICREKGTDPATLTPDENIRMHQRRGRKNARDAIGNER